MKLENGFLQTSVVLHVVHVPVQVGISLNKDVNKLKSGFGIQKA